MTENLDQDLDDMTTDAAVDAQADILAAPEDDAGAVFGDSFENFSGESSARYSFSRKLEVLSDPTGTQSSAVGALRNHLAQQHLGLGRRSLAICSVSADVDRTLVSASLAITAAQSGASTVLVDANMRESHLGDYLTPRENYLGLSDFLSGAVTDPAAVISSEVLPNFSLVHAGSIPQDPQVLLAGRQFEDFISGLMRNFDFTIVDCPPAQQSSDARRIASVMRYAMIVAKRDVTYVSDLKRLVEDLSADRVTVLGTFLNVG